tara:strand:+ start:2329 stop:3519 length:1191 start_codon:yes stop_codon:yes gene_type:complete
MAFKMKGMEFGEGTGYTSPQKMAANAGAAAKAKRAAGKKKVADDPFNYGDSHQKMGESPDKYGDSPNNILPAVVTGARALYTGGRALAAFGGRASILSKAPASLKTKVASLLKKGVKFATLAELYGMAKDAITGGGDDQKKEETPEGVAEKTGEAVADAGKTVAKGKKKSDQMPNSDWKKGQDKAKEMGTDLDALVKKRKTLEKGSDEWKRNQNKINEALGSSKRYDVGPAEKTPTDNSSKLPNATEKTDNVKNTINPNAGTVNVRGGGPAGAKKLEFEVDPETGQRVSERKTKGKSDISMEGKKIKQRNYGETGELDSKIKEKYRRKAGGAEGGMADDYYSDKMKKRKVTVKDGGTVTKTKTKYNKDGTVKRQVTKTRKRRFVNLGRKLSGRRAG